MNPAENIEQFIKKANAVPSAEMNRRTLNDIFEAQESSIRTTSAKIEPNMLRIIMGSRAGSLAATLLIISSLVACLVLSGRIADMRNELVQRDTAIAQNDNSATINFYLKEHQDVIARKASHTAAPQPLQMQVSRHEIMYYEIFDEQPEYIRPGIIVRGPLSQHQTDLPESPAISNGHTLTLPEARESADFELVSPPWLRPCYRLEQIRKIEGRDALQMLYTDGINSVSLFEQPLDGRRGLEPRDFREYAVYLNKGQTGGTILAWRDDTLSYVLIGNPEMSQLMDMAQLINASK